MPPIESVLGVQGDESRAEVPRPVEVEAVAGLPVPPVPSGSVPTERVVAAAWMLRALIMAGERYRVELAVSLGLSATESQAIGYLLVHGGRGQSELARDLGLTSSAATALVDRLELRGVAVRARHRTDRRRLVVTLTPPGEQVAAQSQLVLLDTLDVVPDAELSLLTEQLARMAARLQQQSRP